MKSLKKFNHFVITQFNLRKFPLGVVDENKWIEWTRNRINLYKSYCLPSFLNQSNKNFTWLIYFDSETPEEFNYLIDELNGIEFIEICFADGFNHFKNKYLEDIKSLIKEEEWCIMTRCDNDDCLHKDAIDAIQNSFVPKNEYMISLASGYTLNTKNNFLSHYYYPMSPFISIIESNSQKYFKGIFFQEHTKWDCLRLKITTEIFNKNNSSTFVLKKPLWIQIIHEANVSNSYKRGFPILKSKELADFAINVKTRKQSILSIFSYYDYVHWKRYFKALVVRLLKNR